jgi:hypothetical protein
VKTCPVCATEYPDDVRFCPNDGQTLRSSSPGRDLVGQVIADRYHVVKKLGEGGMGQVYLAEHVKMGRKSAIKVMNPSMVHDPDAVARFNREAANASRVTHPNVCAIYDFGETPEGLIYLAMEFVEGEPLTDVLEREGPLPVSRAALLCAQVADALQAAHDLGIVHRDLKPDNIMLTRGRDGADVVKVVDFGIAKAVGGDDSQKVTKTGLVVGTPEFMSPEQLSGDKVDGRSDVYSLALVLFKTLTGKLPFEASTVQETMIQRLTDEPQKLADVRPDLRFPPGLQETIDAALTRNPVDRYQSAAKFATDVAGVVGLQRGGRLTPLPSTHADGGDQTKLLDAAAASSRSVKRGAPARKRPLVPIVVGAVVVLGAGGAALAVFGPPQRSAGAVPPDTVARPAVKGVDTTTPRRSRARPAAGTPSGGVPTSARAAGAAQAALDMVLDSIDAWPGPLLVDSAKHIYTSAVAPAVRANAAYTLAHIYVDRLNDVQQAHDWIETAVRLDPHNPSYERYRTVINRDYKP